MLPFGRQLAPTDHSKLLPAKLLKLRAQTAERPAVVGVTEEAAHAVTFFVTPDVEAGTPGPAIADLVEEVLVPTIPTRQTAVRRGVGHGIGLLSVVELEDVVQLLGDRLGIGVRPDEPRRVGRVAAQAGRCKLLFFWLGSWLQMKTVAYEDLSSKVLVKVPK